MLSWWAGCRVQHAAVSSISLAIIFMSDKTLVSSNYTLSHCNCDAHNTLCDKRAVMYVLMSLLSRHAVGLC